MTDVSVRNTRNFALVGHSGDGKTSLGESLLHLSGERKELGKVDNGTSTLNYLPEEHDKRATISSKVYSFDWQELHLTLVDTPGDSNFQADGRIALAALDSAILSVSATGGAKVGTSRMLTSARQQGAACIAFVNKMDAERADFGHALETLRNLEAKPVAIALPIGAAHDFQGVIDLLHMRAHTAAGEGEIPAELVADAQAARERLAEAVAECDDQLLEKYIEEAMLSDDELMRGLVTGTRSGAILPVLCGSATRELGITLALRAIRDLLPSPADREAWKARELPNGGQTQAVADPAGPFSALVFKTAIDRYTGTLSVLRIVSGTLHSDSTILNTTTGEKERVGKLFRLQGGEHKDVSAAGPGQIVAIAKAKSVHTGHALTGERGGLRLTEIPIPQGVISYAISAKVKADEDKVHNALGRLVEEDPTLHLLREASTGEFLLSGMGELHVRTSVRRLQRMFGVEVVLHTPKVPYRETIAGKAENVEGKLKKQTGGKGMYGVCYLSVEPKPRGSGVEFSDEIKGGAIPRSLIPAVEKGVIEACHAGPLAGFPVVDLRIRCIDGKHHPVDSNEMAFKLAGSFGFKAAVEQARPTLLEPIVSVEIHTPDHHVGDILGDLSSRRGRVSASEAQGHVSVIQAQVPMAEMLEYANRLTALTGGQGEFHMEFSHYEEAPAQVREQVVAAAKAEQKHET
jgi:elongation factor G